jgi:hypothetical protein
VGAEKKGRDLYGSPPLVVPEPDFLAALIVRRYKVWPVELMELDPREELSAGDVENELRVVVEEKEYNRVFDALRRYGEHDEDCKAVSGHHKLAILDHLCDCGLRQALGAELTDAQALKLGRALLRE